MDNPGKLPTQDDKKTTQNVLDTTVRKQTNNVNKTLTLLQTTGGKGNVSYLVTFILIGGYFYEISVHLYRRDIFFISYWSFVFIFLIYIYHKSSVWFINQIPTAYTKLEVMSEVGRRSVHIGFS